MMSKIINAKKVSIVIIIILTFFSCTSNVSNKAKQVGIQSSNDASIDNNTGSVDSTKRASYFNHIRYLGIEDIRNGFEGTQIRFWLVSSSDSGKLVVLRQKDVWLGLAYYFKYNYDNGRKIYFQSKIKMKKITPCQDGKNFLVSSIS